VLLVVGRSGHLLGDDNVADGIDGGLRDAPLDEAV